MADTKISALSAASTLAGSEVLPVVQGGVTVKATVTQVLAAAQPLDSDLTAIAALTTTSFGRGLLTLANQAALDALFSGTYVPVAGTYAAATTDVFTANVTGDAASRFVLNADGGIEWGGGTGATDTTLYRTAANVLKTDDQFWSATFVFASQGAAAGEVGIGAVGPSSKAGVLFGTAGDTSLYRDAANTLKTDDKLIVALEIEMDGDLNHDGTNVGFYGTAPVARQTGVAVSAAGVHAALVNLGLITA